MPMMLDGIVGLGGARSSGSSSDSEPESEGAVKRFVRDATRGYTPSTTMGVLLVPASLLADGRCLPFPSRDFASESSRSAVTTAECVFGTFLLGGARFRRQQSTSLSEKQYIPMTVLISSRNCANEGIVSLVGSCVSPLAGVAVSSIFIPAGFSEGAFVAGFCRQQ